MLARLIAISRDPRTDDRQGWVFDIELHTADGVALTENLPLKMAILIASANKEGPLYQLCRMIRDAEVGDYQALIGAEFGVA